MRQPRPIVIALGCEEHLRLVLESAEGLRVNHPIAIALKCRPDGIGRLGPETPFTLATARRLRRQHLGFQCFELFSDTCHGDEAFYRAHVLKCSCALVPCSCAFVLGAKCDARHSGSGASPPAASKSLFLLSSAQDRKSQRPFVQRQRTFSVCRDRCPT